MSIAGMDSNG